MNRIVHCNGYRLIAVLLKYYWPNVRFIYVKYWTEIYLVKTAISGIPSGIPKDMDHPPCGHEFFRTTHH